MNSDSPGHETTREPGVERTGRRVELCVPTDGGVRLYEVQVQNYRYTRYFGLCALDQYDAQGHLRGGEHESFIDEAATTEADLMELLAANGHTATYEPQVCAVRVVWGSSFNRARTGQPEQWTDGGITDRPCGKARGYASTVHAAIDGVPVCGAAVPEVVALPARFNPWLNKDVRAERFAPRWAPSYQTVTCRKCIKAAGL